MRQSKSPNRPLIQKVTVATVVYLFASFASYASETGPRVFSVPSTGITMLTGDSWMQGGNILRLYGIQSCVRGTTYTDGSGAKKDCGVVSLLGLAAFLRDTRPQCTPLAQVKETMGRYVSTTLVICNARIGLANVDLGTALIAKGFAFAAFSSDAQPVYMPYHIAESMAQQSKAGLWAFPDMPHPNRVLNVE